MQSNQETSSVQDLKQIIELFVLYLAEEEQFNIDEMRFDVTILEDETECSRLEVAQYLPHIPEKFDSFQVEYHKNSGPEEPLSVSVTIFSDASRKELLVTDNPSSKQAFADHIAERVIGMIDSVEGTRH